MTEFFIVPYPTNRPVFVDGGPNGRTNRVQSIERGSHTFDLGEPVDYFPDAQFTLVADTSFENPQVIAFTSLMDVAPTAASAATAPPKKKTAKRKTAKKKKARKKIAKKKRTRRAKHR